MKIRISWKQLDQTVAVVTANIFREKVRQFQGFEPFSMFTAFRMWLSQVLPSWLIIPAWNQFSWRCFLPPLLPKGCPQHSAINISASLFALNASLSTKRQRLKQQTAAAEGRWDFFFFFPSHIQQAGWENYLVPCSLPELLCAKFSCWAHLCFSLC